MKKLLSAVTSAAMSLSLIGSAFASTLTVSAAGSIPVVQPNVSIGTEADVSANKNAAADFVVKPGEYTVDTSAADFDGNLFVDVYLDAVINHHVSMVTAFLNQSSLPAGITLDPDQPYQPEFPAVGSTASQYLNGGIYINCLKGGEPVC